MRHNPCTTMMRLWCIQYLVCISLYLFYSTVMTIQVLYCMSALLNYHKIQHCLGCTGTCYVFMQPTACYIKYWSFGIVFNGEDWGLGRVTDHNLLIFLQPIVYMPGNYSFRYMIFFGGENEIIQWQWCYKLHSQNIHVLKEMNIDATTWHTWRVSCWVTTNVCVRYEGWGGWGVGEWVKARMRDESGLLEMILRLY